MPSVTRVMGYIRVSTDRQADSGLGLEAQRQRIEAECKRRGWVLSELIVDEGLSGKTMKRPGLMNALEALKEGNAEVLMAAKLDRLSRSVLDVCNIGSMANHYGWSLVLLDCNIDTTSPYGVAQLNMMATFAQLERELIGLRTREALAVKKAQGCRLGRPVAIARLTEERILSLRSKGLTMAAIADELNTAGVETARGGRWYASTVRQVLARAEAMVVAA